MEIFHAALGQCNQPVTIHGDKAVLFQPFGRVGHAGFRNAEMLRYVNGADIAVPLPHHQHGFQIVLCRSVHTHSKLHQPFFEIIFYTNTLDQKKQANIFFGKTY